MSDTVTIEGIDVLKGDLAALTDGGAKALRAARRKTRTQTRREIAKRLSTVVFLTAKAIRDGKDATRKKILRDVDVGGSPAVRVSGEPILIRPSTSKGNTQYQARGLKKGGVSMTVRKDRGREKSSKGFIVTFKSGFVGVARSVKGKKTSKGKQKLKLYQGPSIPNAMEHGGVLDDIQVWAAAKLVANLALEIERSIFLERRRAGLV